MTEIDLIMPAVPLVDETTGMERYEALDSDQIYEDLSALRKAFIDLYGYRLASGSFREVWANGHTIYKLPYASFDIWGGCSDNLYEAGDAHTEYAKAGMVVAPCRIAWHESGIPILVMEAVDPMPAIGCAPRPDWSGFVDANQVGLRANGEWAVYDAGHSPNKYFCNTHRHAPTPPAFNKAA